jgi:hypothetical protein
MKITLKRTPEQIELVKAMASKNRDVAYEAQVALAEFIGPVLAKVVNQAPTLSNLFSNFAFNADESPSIPMDLYYDITDEDYVNVWSQTVPGGLPTNTVTPIGGEMKFTTYRLDSAVDFDKRYAQRSRMDVISKSFTRVAQEILLKQERNSATLVLGALSEATTKGRSHIITANGAQNASGGNSRLILDDFNRLLTLGKRINTAWTGGTPEGGIGGRGVTDLIVSPEVVQGLREMAYNPINTNSSPKTDIVATDSMREAVYSNGGIPEFYGINIMELQEMGKGQRFNKLFDTLAGSKNIVDAAASGTPNAEFDDAKHEIVLGLDKRVESFLRAVATDSETGSEFSLVADDQYSVRQSKIGYYGSIEEGRIILDYRALFGIVC